MARGAFEAGEYGSRNFHFGFREHGMAAVLNGMALSKVRPSCRLLRIHGLSAAFAPSDAIMGLPVLYVLTHDSIGLGEDGPTHQPVEHLAALRAIPKLITLRPGDANEVAEAYRTILHLKNRPVALILSRQELAHARSDQVRSGPPAQRNGAYVLADARMASRRDPDRHRQRIAICRRSL